MRDYFIPKNHNSFTVCEKCLFKVKQLECENSEELCFFYVQACKIFSKIQKYYLFLTDEMQDEPKIITLLEKNGFILTTEVSKDLIKIIPIGIKKGDHFVGCKNDHL